MEQSGVSLETNLHHQLYQDDQLDFDPNVEFDVEDAEAVDLNQDKPWENHEQVAEPLPENSTASVNAVEVSNGDYDALSAVEDAEHIQDGEEEEDANAIGEETGAEAQEEQDEIGYEDEGSVTGELDATTGVAAEDDVNVDLADDRPEYHERQDQPPDATGAGVAIHDAADMSWQHDVNAGDDVGAKDEPLEAEDVEEPAAQAEANDALAAENVEGDAHQTEVDAAHLERYLDQIIEDHSPPPRRIPNIEVIYNDEYYSLFGTEDEDPNTYFLSDPDVLGDSLSQFLASLRDVVSEDIAPTDELVIRLDALDFEFGERSSDKFLNRSFHEILECHESLTRVSGTSAEPVVIQLIVRRDTEEHFLELLSQAERAKNSPEEDEDSEMSDNADEHTPVSASDDGDAGEDGVDAENLDEHGPDGEAAVTDSGVDQAAPEEPALETVHDHEGDPGDQAETSATSVVTGEPEATPVETYTEDDQEHAEPSEEASGGVSVEGQAWEEPEPDPLGDSTDVQHVEVAEDSYVEQDDHEETGEEPRWNDQEVEDHTEFAEHDIHLEVSEQQDEPDQQQEPGSPLESTHLNAADEATNHGDGEPEEDEGQHDDDLILAFDEEPNHQTGSQDEDEHEGDGIAYSAEDDSVEVDEDTHEQGTVGMEFELRHEIDDGTAPITTATETQSIHTSTTINGDEIDYDEEDVAQSVPTENGEQQFTAPSEVDNDEIGWDNDDDETEQTPAEHDNAVEIEFSTAAPQSPPSGSSKRTRPDEPEGLAEETDHKRRRT
ncbi:hypothetical protein VTJ04DRAFT_1203 [Mycothermus thermophilus]|uniref:uncharacterized protein n=1 Tax=Humicola insolens TaxID=85995 RepID=UPI0037441749